MSRKASRPQMSPRELIDLAGVNAPGLEPFAELILAASEKRAPAPQAVATLAAAAEVLFTKASARARLEAFGQALDMMHDQGKGRAPERVPKARWRAIAAVMRAERRLLASGQPRRQALAQAARDVAAREAIPLRTLQSWLRDLRAQSAQRRRAAATVIRAGRVWVALGKSWNVSTVGEFIARTKTEASRRSRNNK